MPNRLSIAASLVFCLVILGTATCEAVVRAPSDAPPGEATRLQTLGSPWAALWMGTGTDAFRDVGVMVGAVFAAGHTRHLFPASPDRNILLVKYSTEGQQVWNRTWPADCDEAAYGIAVSSPWVYLAGATASMDSQGDGLLVKLDLAGNVAWNATWGGGGADWFSRVAVGSDGIYVVGCTRSYGAGDSDALLVKFDSDGHQLWNATWGGLRSDSGSGVVVATDGVYFSGQMTMAADGGSNATLVKFSLAGLQVWNASWSVDSQSAGMGLAVADDNIYVTGWTRNAGLESRARLILLKFTTTGSLLWNRTYSTAPLSNDLGYSVALASDLVYVAGDSRAFLTDASQSILLCFNASGSFRWSRTWGGVKDCNSHALASAVDGLYLAGATSGWLTGEGDGVLVKWGFNGTSPPGPVQLSTPSEVDHDGTFPVSWSSTFDPDGVVTGYQLLMGWSPDFTESSANWTTTSTSLVIEGLSEGGYYFRVRAQDDAGLYGPWSNTARVAVSILPTLPLNPWLAPAVLIVAVGAMAAIVIMLTIRHRRFEAGESPDLVLLLPLSF